MNSNHLWWGTALAAASAALYLPGAAADPAVLLLWPLLCMAMMAAMMWGMSRRP